MLTGIAIGGVGAVIFTRTRASLSHLLYGVGSGDALTFAVVSILLIALAACAGYIPARRAAKVDPMVALGYERQASPVPNYVLPLGFRSQSIRFPNALGGGNRPSAMNCPHVSALGVSRF